MRCYITAKKWPLITSDDNHSPPRADALLNSVLSRGLEPKSPLVSRLVARPMSHFV